MNELQTTMHISKKLLDSSCSRNSELAEQFCIPSLWFLNILSNQALLWQNIQEPPTLD